ncbi:MAG: SDR family NAD(P)-dependent oxidoreductase, partial [Alphaproteobacteria bacterium]|nr:SDR family NAD(P)-dependent oxidoreductase [Alphaproteobacteria bacterium]
VKDGANVTLMGRRMDRLESAKSSMADRYGADSIELAQGDVANEADVVRAIEIASRNQHLDIVVASAGRGADRWAGNSWRQGLGYWLRADTNAVFCGRHFEM